MPPVAAKIRPAFVRLGKFTTSKLIQNLGSGTEQYKFSGSLRTVHGRD